MLFSEIAKVRASLFQINGVKKEPLKLPEPDGTPVTLNEKVYVPVREHPDVSRIFNLYSILCSCCNYFLRIYSISLPFTMLPPVRLDDLILFGFASEHNVRIKRECEIVAKSNAYISFFSQYNSNRFQTGRTNRLAKKKKTSLTHRNLSF